MSRSDDEIDLLLARGRLGGPGREELLRRTLDRAAPRRRWVWAAAPLVMAAAAALVLLVRPDGFRARGGDGGPLLEVTCHDGAHDRCAAGERLLFHVDGAAVGGRLAAWAEPAGGGERVWYFPSLEGELPEVAAQLGPQLLRQAVLLGPEQPPGRYEIHLVLLDAALPREAIAAAHPRAARMQRLEVVGR